MISQGLGYIAGSGIEFFGKNYIKILDKFITTINDIKKQPFELIISRDEVYNCGIIPYTDFETQNNYKKELLKTNNNIVQIWFQNQSNPQTSIISSIIYKKLKEYIGDNYSFDRPTFKISLYNKDCFIKKHKDGEAIDSRCFVVLLYLNKDWKKEYGGQLIINDLDNNEIIINPEFGNFAILNFTEANLEHSVTPVLVNDIDRTTLISFINIKI
jgi:Rps23 Pro-64 3,4-dihydroxylase Tpa1-like proline 4-hydroxylase